MAVQLPPAESFVEVQPLRHASREVVRELGFLQGFYEEFGIPYSHSHSLIELAARGTLTQNELAALLRLDKSTTSRIAAELARRGWVRTASDATDGRRRPLALTKKGRELVARIHEHSNERVRGALACLTADERALVARGVSLYAKALERSRRRAAYVVRELRRPDNPGVASVIRAVMPEFGASGPGFAIHDPEVDDMHSQYSKRRAAYFVVTDARGRIAGGGGIAPLEGGDAKTCELRKMYFLPELRGLGLGQVVIERCLEAARERGFKRCYLETLATMAQARKLYERNGFKKLCKPLGDTGHFGCDSWYAREL